MTRSSLAEEAAGAIDLAALEAVMHEAAEAAAAITLPLFRTGIAVENKHETGFDPVTEADRQAEAAIRALIEARFPDHGIIGEEWPEKPARGPFTWIVDPIDGTRAFISGVPVWGTLIGIAYRGRAIAGLMAQPFNGEVFASVPGRAEYHRGGTAAPLRTSGVTALEKAKLTTTAPEQFDSPRLLARWEDFRPRVLQTRYGLDCYGYCLMAAGQIDLVVEAGLKDVDIAPLIPIIENAGGVVTTWDEKPAEAGGNCVAAATPELHAAAIEALSRSGR